MHDTISHSGSPSDSQSGIETEYVEWSAPGSPSIAVRRRVMEGIHQEVGEAFAAVPRRGAETGGILLGSRDGDRLVVEDFEPVPCEHRFGPSYRLSDVDREAMAESLEWFRSCARPGLFVLGYYRSHTLPDFALSEADEELLSSHFPDPGNVVLLIKPSRMGDTVADFFIRRDGHTEEAFTPITFPFTGAGAVAQISWPSPRPRLIEEPEAAPKSRWIWYVAAIVLGVAGGALGYLYSHQAPQPAPAQSQQQVPQPALHRNTEVARSAPPVPAAALPALREQAAPAVPATPAAAGVHALLDRWSSALKLGDNQAAAACYAPLVSTYFERHDVSREAVRQSIRRSLTRYGGLDIFRISGLAITPSGDGRAVAVFLKHWQTSGYRKFSGEERERMTLARNQGVWQIVAEQQEESHDKRKSR
jgi:proteasome lid subunit RPN8/RPN11